ncbi:hypothetical protein H6G01_11290 [Leptolyngbya sp. FACHB-17]|nr:hypothetical protein [Leptolyngbya sp. FACHB-17]
MGYPDGKPTLSNVRRSQQVKDLLSTHRANLQQNLQRRIESARQKGDEALLTLLEAERRHLT